MQKYHMNKYEREITDNCEIKEILEKGKYTVISMCRDNEPYVVTLSYGYDKDNHSLYFHTALRGLKLDILKSNPLVCATVIDDRGYIMDECEHSYRSVVFWGNISIVDSLEEKKHGMDVLINHLEDMPSVVKARIIKDDKMYNNMSVLRLSIEQITGKKEK